MMNDESSNLTATERLAARSLEIRPIQTALERAQLAAAAEADAHKLILPTHGFWRKDTPVGYASICVTPCVHTWFSTRHCSGRDSYPLIQRMEEMVREQGHGIVVVPVWEQSPFAPVMSRLGYEPFLETTLYAKILHPPSPGSGATRKGAS